MGDLTPIRVALVTAVVWGAVVAGPFHFDDHLVPLGDPASRSLGDLAARAGTTLRPMTKLTYALEGSAGLGDVAPARRATGVAIHAVAAGLLASLLVSFTGSSGAGALALLWSLHPVHAESALAVSGRSAALAGAFVLAAVVAQTRERRWTAALLLLAAALARETATAALVAIAALEAARSPSWRDAARRVVPAALATTVAAAWLVSVPRYRMLAEFSFEGRPWSVSVARQVAAIPHGLLLYVRPDLLSVDHGTALPDRIVSPLAVAGLVLLAAAAGGTAVAIRRGAWTVAAGLALWLAAILPTQSLVPKLDPLTERPLGLALAGLLLAASASLVRAAARGPRKAVATAAAVLAIALAVATVGRGRLYASDLTLWADAAAKSETNPRPHVNYAVALLEAGRPAEAREAFRAALRIDPLNVQAARALEHLSRE